MADALAAHGELLCVPAVETTDAGVVLTVTVPTVGQASGAAALDAVELLQELQRVADMVQLRALAQRYDIDPAALEALLLQKKGSA